MSEQVVTREEHIAEAERSLKIAESCYWEGDTAKIDFAQTCLMAAQTHAMLAAFAPTRSSQDAADER